MVVAALYGAAAGHAQHTAGIKGLLTLKEKHPGGRNLEREP